MQIRQPSQAVDAMKKVVGRVTGWKASGWPDLPWYVTSGAANLRGRWWFSRREKEEHPRCGSDCLHATECLQCQGEKGRHIHEELEENRDDPPAYHLQM